MLRRQWLAVPFLLSSAFCLALLAMLPRFDAASGLTLERGMVGVFGDEDPEYGLSLSVQGTDRQICGFFEWPGEGIYGFYSADRDDLGEYKGSIHSGTGKSSGLSVDFGKRWEEAAITFSGEGLPGRAASLKRRDVPGAPTLELFRGSFLVGRNPGAGRLAPWIRGWLNLGGDSGAGTAKIHLESLEGATGRAAGAGGIPADAALFDAGLRAGEAPLIHARGLTGRVVAQAAKLAESGTAAGYELFERQCLIFISAEAAMVATERYVFQGGAHGATTTVFKGIDRTGAAQFQPDRLLRSGSEQAVKALLRTEALRVLELSTPSSERRNEGTGLEKFGFFEDDIDVSGKVFFCRTGVGFHYDRYQLAPYSEGDFMFILPWSALEGALEDEGFPERLRLGLSAPRP